MPTGGVGRGPAGPDLGRESQQMRRVRALISHQGAQLEHMTEREIHALWPVLEEARRELAADLARWLGRVDGAEAFTAQQLRNALVMVDRVMRDVDVAGATGKVVTRVGRDAEQLSAEHLTAELARLAEWFEGSVHPVSIREAAVVAAGDHELVRRFANSAARYAEDVRVDLRRQFAVGFTSNETFDQLTRRLVRIGGPRGVVFLRGRAGVPGSYAEQITEGLFARYRGWASRLVRTEGVNAYNVVHQRGLEEAHAEDASIMKRWDSTRDLRTCPACRGLDGEVVAVRARFSCGLLFPPLHPCCRCTEVPWKEAWSRYLLAAA